MKGENGIPETPDWSLPAREVVTGSDNTIPPNVELGTE